MAYDPLYSGVRFQAKRRILLPALPDSFLGLPTLLCQYSSGKGAKRLCQDAKFLSNLDWTPSEGVQNTANFSLNFSGQFLREDVLAKFSHNFGHPDGRQVIFRTPFATNTSRLILTNSQKALLYECYSQK
jgi:hypothetical protein